MLAVYPWAFLICGKGIPETYELIRVKRSPLFYLCILKNAGCGLYSKEKQINCMNAKNIITANVWHSETIILHNKNN